MENSFIRLEIVDHSSLPKYKQIVKAIIDNLEIGRIAYGQKLPSINQMSFDYYLSRDTVEKAYGELKERGIIEAVKGKGYYITDTTPESKIKVLVLFNKLSSYKKTIYNTIAHQLGERARINLVIYHCEYDLFERTLKENLQGYQYYVIMPHFIDHDHLKLKKLLGKISPEKLIFLDHIVEGFEECHGAVFQDFKMDIYHALEKSIAQLKRYEKLILVFPRHLTYPYPEEIIVGFRRFCAFENFEYEIIGEVNEYTKLKSKTAYIVLEETDLVNLIKNAKQNNLAVKDDIGILSYNDTPLKEVLADGISVITTDFEQMGTLAAEMIIGKRTGSIKNDFHLILRNSL